MSTFPIPEVAVTEMERLEQMNRDFAAMLPKELAGTANLLVHPAAGVAAVSALGFGLASHAFGVWMGAVAGASEAAQRMLSADFGHFAGASDVKSSQRSASKKAEVTAASLIAEVKTLALRLEKAEARTKTKTAVVAEATVEAAVVLQPEDFRQPPAMEKSGAPDDLKAITGIGPKLEQVLNGLSIWTYRQIAAWTAEEVAWADDYLGFKGRIGRDDWIGQAAKLAGGKTAE